MIKLESKGDFRRTNSFLTKMSTRDRFKTLSKFGHEGVAALSSATPVESGLAASSWSYKVEVTSRSASISWNNVNRENGFPVAIMLQYGYGTGTGGYVHGRDYINPALKPIFDKIAESVWREVTSA